MNNREKQTNKRDFFDSEEMNKERERFLFLMPLVQTAWAHGAIARREKQMIFEAAREDGIDERSPLNDRLAEYLVYQPSRRFFADCLGEISRLLQAMPVHTREQQSAKIISRCRRVAESAGGNSEMDVSAFVSPEERQVLAEISESLNLRPPVPLRETLTGRSHAYV